MDKDKVSLLRRTIRSAFEGDSQFEDEITLLEMGETSLNEQGVVEAPLILRLALNQATSLNSEEIVERLHNIARKEKCWITFGNNNINNYFKFVNNSIDISFVLNIPI